MVSLNCIFLDKKKYKNWAKSFFLEPIGRVENPLKNLIQANFLLVIKAEEHEKKLFLFTHTIRWKSFIKLYSGGCLQWKCWAEENSHI